MNKRKSLMSSELRTIPLLLLGVICLAGMLNISSRAVAQTNPLPASAPVRSTTVPYIPLYVGGKDARLPLIHVLIDNKVTATFLVDTGTNITLISDQIATRLGLPLQRAIHSNGTPYLINGKNVKFVTASLQIATTLIPHLPMAIEPIQSFRRLAGRSFDGVLGTNVLHSSALLLDPNHHQLTFWFPGNLSPQETADVFQKMQVRSLPVVPLTEHDQSFFAQGRFYAGKHQGTETMIVDTGSVSTFVTTHVLRQMQLSPVKAVQTSRMLQGNYRISLATVDGLQLGTTVFRDLTVEYFSGQAHPDVLPSLGLDILSQGPVLMDFPARKLYLLSNPPATLPLLSAPANPPVVSLSLHGRTTENATGSFLISTSMDISSFTVPLSIKLGFGSPPATNVKGKSVSIEGLTVPHASLGDLPIPSTTFFILPAASYAPLGYSIDGILGMDVLGNHAFLLDLSQHQITIWDKNAFMPSDLARMDMADAVAIPLLPVADSSQFCVSAKLVNGTSSVMENLALDTAQHANVVSPHSVQTLGLSAAETTIPSSTAIQHTTVPEVSLGSLVLHDFPAAYVVDPKSDDYPPSLGMAFFSQCRVLFDFAHKIMYVKANSPSIH